jgi:HAD superfamily hydrolase (TIGR01458 family)
MLGRVAVPVKDTLRLGRVVVRSGGAVARAFGGQRLSVRAAGATIHPMPQTPSLPDPDLSLRSQVSGVRGLLIDMDGVLVMRGALVPGAAEAIAALDRHGFPYLIATNTSMMSRETLSGHFRRVGIEIPPGRIVSAASVAGAYARRHFSDEPLYVMVAPDARVEFEGLRLLSHEEAAESGAQVAAVLVGDAGGEFTPRNLQSAFTLLRGGARFVAMHKNRWWYTPEGAMLDSGAYVAALEFGTQRRALVTGKPSRAFFAEGVRQLGLTAGEVAMVGDDLWNDVRGAQRAGLVGVFVRSGKQGDADLDRFAAERHGGAPDAVAPSIAEVVAALVR